MMETGTQHAITALLPGGGECKGAAGREAVSVGTGGLGVRDFLQALGLHGRVRGQMEKSDGEGVPPWGVLLVMLLGGLLQVWAHCWQGSGRGGGGRGEHAVSWKSHPGGRSTKGWAVLPHSDLFL